LGGGTPPLRRIEKETRINYASISRKEEEVKQAH